MKTIDTYIIEKLKISKKPITKHTLFPKDRDELIDMIEAEIEKHGDECSLNHIDVSNITNMSRLFIGTNFNGDISEWNVSNVTNMHSMFAISNFNGDISGWDISSVENMDFMFADSKFNNDISNWDISNIKHKFSIFINCPINDKYKPRFK